MPLNEPHRGLLPSIIDRLTDPDSEGTKWRQGYDLEQIIDSIRQDLEELLNAHPPHSNISPEWTELPNSLLAFGLPDLTSIRLTTQSEQQQLAKLVEQLVERFEPRLRNIRAILVDTPKEGVHNVRFHIEAEINVDPAPAVTFETVLELTTGQASIKTANQ